MYDRRNIVSGLVTFTEITAANMANVCTYAVMGVLEIDQVVSIVINVTQLHLCEHPSLHVEL